MSKDDSFNGEDYVTIDGGIIDNGNDYPNSNNEDCGSHNEEIRENSLSINNTTVSQVSHLPQVQHSPQLKFGALFGGGGKRGGFFNKLFSNNAVKKKEDSLDSLVYDSRIPIQEKLVIIDKAKEKLKNDAEARVIRLAEIDVGLAKAEATKSVLELEMSQLTIQRAQNQIAMEKGIQASLMKVLGATKDIELAIAEADKEVSITSLRAMKKIDSSAKIKSVFFSHNARELEGDNPGALTKAAEKLNKLSKEVSREVDKLKAAVEAKQAELAMEKLKEVEDGIRSDTLESEELFAALFGRNNWSRMEARGLASGEEKDEERPEEFGIKLFGFGRRYEVGNIKMKGSIKMNPYLLQVDVATIINLNLAVVIWMTLGLILLRTY